MSSSVADPIAVEIKRLHSGITTALRRSVQDAIRIGELLTQKKEALEHGYFLTWIHESVGFTDRTAQRYMRLHQWKEALAKYDSVSDLAEAYRRVELLETKERQKARPVENSGPYQGPEPEQTSGPVIDPEVSEEPPRRSGPRPTPFRGPSDAEWKDKMDRIRAEDADLKDQARQEDAERPDLEDLQRRAGEFSDQLREAAERFGHLGLSGGADNFVQVTVFNVLQRYVMSFEAPGRRVEVAHNLIKALRLLIHEINGEEASA